MTENLPDDQRYLIQHLGTVSDPSLTSGKTPLVFSYGAGLDSWFVTTRLLTSDDEPWRSLRDRLALIVHADLGAELPETTAHLENVARPFMLEHGWDLTVMLPRVVCRSGHLHTDIRSYLECQGVVPSRTRRWCSQRFKIEPIQDAAQAILRVPIWIGFDTLLGYDASEGHRTARLSDRQRAKITLPLMELGLDRLSMRALLVDEGWPEETIPIKSRCSFCIFSKVAEIVAIDQAHPEILDQDIETEERIVATNCRPEFTFLHRPLRAIRDDYRRRALQTGPRKGDTSE